MPALTNGSATAVRTKPKRFELPALDFQFASLTEGTDIPPPLPSPIAEEPSDLKAADAAQPAAAVTASSAMSGTNDGRQPNTPTSATTTTATAAGPGSILRPDSRSDGSLLDERRARRSSGWFRRLRGGGSSEGLASSNGSLFNVSLGSGAPSNGSGNGPRSPLSKRSSILFSDVRRQQQQQPPQQPQAPAKPTAPPPPMIPELGELGAKVDLDDGLLSGDLFKNIK